MPLLAMDEIDAFRRKYAHEFAQHERVVKAMRAENISMLRTERPRGAEDRAARKMLGKDFTGGNHQAFRAENFASRPTAHDVDTKVPPDERGTSGYVANPVAEQEAIDERDNEGFSDPDSIAPGNVGKNASAEARVKDWRADKEESVSDIVNRVVKDECNKMKDQWTKDYKFARDMIVTNPVGLPSFASKPRRDKAYEAAPRPAATGSALDAATHRMIDRIVGAEVTQMVNSVMHANGIALDQTTGEVRTTRSPAADSRLSGLGELLDALECDASEEIMDPHRNVMNPSPVKTPVSNSPARQGNQHTTGVPVGFLTDKPRATAEHGTDVNDPDQMRTNRSAQPPRNGFKSDSDAAADDVDFDPNILQAFLKECERCCPPEQLSDLYQWLGYVDPSLIGGGAREGSSATGQSASGQSMDAAMDAPHARVTAAGVTLPPLDAAIAISTGDSDSLSRATRARRLGIARRVWGNVRSRGASDAALSAAVRAIGRNLAARATGAKR
jgi:hypothetical protein